MRLPRTVLLALCALLTAAAYYAILFTNWANYYRGAAYLGVVGTQAVLVLAVFCCVEVMRTERLLPIRALAGALGVPLALVILLLCWYGVHRYLAA
jgi:hypothetical protein